MMIGHDAPPLPVVFITIQKIIVLCQDRRVVNRNQERGKSPFAGGNSEALTE